MTATAPPATPTAPTAAKRSTWWIVPLVIVGLIIVAWLLLAGLPFGGDDREEVRQTATTETIAEGTAGERAIGTGTVIEVAGPGEEPLATETAPQPPLATSTPSTTPPVTVPPAVTQTVAQTQTTAPPRTQPQPRTPPQPRTQPQPRPQPPVVAEQPRTTTTAPTPRPEPTPAPASREISDAEGSAVLRGFLASSNPYGVTGSCLQIRSLGYRNVGYTYSVWDACVQGGGSRMLGRWRVDSKTREVFRQREDGRYLRP